MGVGRPDAIQTMTDYYSILRKAVTDRDQPSEAERYELYERARRMVVSRLRGTDPPWLDADIDEQLAAFDDAVARLESEFKNERVRPAPHRRGSVAREGPPVEHALRPQAARAVAAPRRRTGLAIVGVLAAALLIGLGLYYIPSRDHPPPQTPIRPAEPAQSTSAKTGPMSDRSAGDPAQASYVLRKQHVYYRTTHPSGTVMISRGQRFLYIVQPNQVAIRYAIGVGPECVDVVGLFQITDKVNRPSPDENQVRHTEGASPSNRKGEMEARFGPRALYFGGGGHAVHGTAEPARIGQSASFGCFHQWNQDIVDLYDRVPLNQRVVVAN
jgi:lipoprotein-anchoring transpeptidase ErfK/SrfK